MTTPEAPHAGTPNSGGDRLTVGAFGLVAAIAATAALVSAFRTPDDMLPVVLLYAAAGTAAAAGIRVARSRGVRPDGCKLVAGATVMALLVTVVLWTLAGSWSTIGRCERREASVWTSDTVDVWYEGTACTDEDREHYLYDF